MEPIIRLQNIYKKIDRQIILSDVTLDIPASQTVAVIGPSGSGKSSLLRLLMGLEPPSSGSIEIDGRPLWRAKARGKGYDMVHLRHIRAKVGMVFQQFNLFPHLSALENVMAAPYYVLKLDKGAAQERATRYLEMVDLGDKMHTYPAHLSGGQKRRVAIARALAMQPKIMLFDEITSALDPELIGGILAILQQLAAKKTMTMIIVTHHMQFAKQCADRVLFFENGRIIEDNDAQGIFNSPSQERTRNFFKALNES